MLTRSDVERIIENAFKELTIEVKERSDERTITVLYRGERVCETWLNVRDRESPEYD
jgi:hypothetical protein